MNSLLLLLCLWSPSDPQVLRPTRPEPPPVGEGSSEAWMDALTDRALSVPAAERPASWDASLLMLGLLEAGEVRARRETRAYAAAWLRRHEPALQFLGPDDAAPAAVAARLRRLAGGTEWDRVLGRLWAWLLQRAPLAYNAGLLYEGRSLALNSLYPLPALLAEWNPQRDRPPAPRFAAWQLMAHLAYLDEPQTGLLRHAWDAEREQRWGEFWGQGHARALLGLAETIARLDPNAESRESLQIEGRRLSRAVLARQRPSGAWGLLLDDPNSPDDFLATTLLLAALEISAREDPGAFPAQAAERGLRWVQGQVDARGGAPPVYLSLLPGYRASYLRAVPRPSPAGDGALLLLLSARWRRVEGEKLRGTMGAER